MAIDKIIQSQGKNSHSSELPHQLKFYMLIFFIEGSGRHFVDFNWYPVEENSLVYLSKGQIHAFDFSQNLNGFCIVFTEKYLLGSSTSLQANFAYRLANPQIFSPVVQISKILEFNTYSNLLREEFNNLNSYNREDILDSLFAALILKLESLKQNQLINLNDASTIETYQKFTFLIEKNISISRSASFYAKEIAISYKHLNSICKKLVNKTAKSVIDDVVILHAKRSLIYSTLNIAQVANLLGFEDQTNFSKYFKKHTGLTPKSFIKTTTT